MLRYYRIMHHVVYLASSVTCTSHVRRVHGSLLSGRDFGGRVEEQLRGRDLKVVLVRI